MNKREFIDFYNTLENIIHNLLVIEGNLTNILKYVEIKRLKESIKGKLRSIGKMRDSFRNTRDLYIKKYPEYHEAWKISAFGNINDLTNLYKLN